MRSIASQPPVTMKMNDIFKVTKLKSKPASKLLEVQVTSLDL